MSRTVAVLLLAAAASAAPAPDPFSREAIAEIMRKVNGWQIAHPVMPPESRDWERSTWYTGVMAAYKATGERSYLDQALAWGAQHKWQVGRERLGSNRLFATQTWLECYFAKKDPAMIAPLLAWMADRDPISPTANPRWYAEGYMAYSDALYGAPGLVMLSRATGDKRYAEIAHAFFRDVTAELLDREAGLFYRDKTYIGKRTANGRKTLWSRGNGWVFGGIVRVLEYLPPDDPERPRYVQLLNTMAAAIVKAQGADGLWRPNLADPEQYAAGETSGTGFFCYGLAWGINHGLLDRATYLPATKKAWLGLVSAVSPEGKVQWGQPVDGQPNPTRKDDSHEFVTGTFLLAASEMWRLK